MDEGTDSPRNMGPEDILPAGLEDILPVTDFPTSQKTDDDLPITAIRTDHSNELLIVRGRLEDKEVRILIDGGAKGNFMSRAMGQSLQLDGKGREGRTVTVADGTTHQCFQVKGLSLEVECTTKG